MRHLYFRVLTLLDLWMLMLLNPIIIFTIKTTSYTVTVITFFHPVDLPVVINKVRACTMEQQCMQQFPMIQCFHKLHGYVSQEPFKNCRSFTWHKRAKSVDIYTKTFIQNFLKLFIDITFCFFTLSNNHNLTIS